MSITSSMKFLKNLILGVLIGELIALFSSNQKMKAKLKKTEGRSKVGVVFDELVEMNKKLIDEARELDYKKAYEETEHFVKDQFEDFEKKLDSAKETMVKKWGEAMKEIGEHLNGYAKEMKKNILKGIISMASEDKKDS